MNREHKPRVRHQTAHAAYLGIVVGSSFQIRIIAYYICCRLEIEVFPALEELDDLRGVLKPFVIIQVEEPFAFCFPKSCVSCLCKVITPGEWNDVGGVLSGNFPDCRVFSREDKDQFAVQILEDGGDGIKAFFQGVHAVRDKNGDGELWFHKMALLFFYGVRVRRYSDISKIAFLYAYRKRLLSKKKPFSYENPLNY